VVGVSDNLHFSLTEINLVKYKLILHKVGRVVKINIVIVAYTIAAVRWFNSPTKLWSVQVMQRPRAQSTVILDSYCYYNLCNY